LIGVRLRRPDLPGISAERYVKFVITSFGSLGDLNPYLGLSRALVARGHEVVLAIPGHYVPLAEAAGVRAQAVRPEIDPNQRDVVRRVMDPFKGAEYLIRDLMMPNVEPAYEDLDALVEDDDILVSHPLTYAAPVLAERRGMLWASTVLAPLSFFSRSDPPLMAVHPAAEFVQRKLPGFYRRLIPVARIATRNWTPQVASLRRRLGLPPGEDPVHAGQFSPYLNLAMFSPVLGAPQTDWPPATVITGAVSYDAVHGGMPSPLAEFLDSGSPPIVFTLGSSAIASEHAPRFYQASVDASTELGARAVLLIGQHDGHAPTIRSSKDVFIAEWAPHSQLFPRASVIVHQGGAGTLHTALASGRPMLIVPFAHDQGDNAVRTVRSSVARVIFPTQYRRKAVAMHLRALMTESIRARAEVIGVTVRAEQGALSASLALEALAKRRGASTAA
jgi:UDP:flavonoid glycosyltransferase YjiC (YdhE family)